MAKNLAFKEARKLELPVPVGTSSGDPVVISTLPGVAMTNRNSAGNATVDTKGAYTLPVKAVDNSGDNAISKGDDLYFVSEDTPKISKKTSGTYYGKALGTVSAGEIGSIDIRLGDGPSTVAAVVVVDDTTIENDESAGLQIKDTGVNVNKLSVVANDRPVTISIGAVSATTTVIAFVAPTAGFLKSASIVNKNAITANDTDYWSLSLVNKGGSGSGTDEIVAKTTQATGGSALEAYVPLSLGTLDADKKILAAGDVVTLTLTKAASAAALAETTLALVWVPTEA